MILIHWAKDIIRNKARLDAIATAICSVSSGASNIPSSDDVAGVKINPCDINTIGYAINSGSEVVRSRPIEDVVEDSEDARLSFGVSFE